MRDADVSFVDQTTHLCEDEPQVEFLAEEDKETNFENDLTSIRLKCCCLMYSFVGLLFCIGTISFRVGSISKEDVANNTAAYSFLSLVLNIMKIANIVTLIYYKYTTHKYRSFIFEIDIENSQVIYFIVLPTTVGSVTYSMLTAMHNDLIGSYNIGFITPIVQILFDIATVMLIIDIVGSLHTGENYHLKVVTIWAQSITLVGVTNNVLFHITSCQLFKFTDVTSKFYNLSYYPPTKRDTMHDILVFMEPLAVSWGIIVFCYILHSLKRNLMDIEELTTVYLRSMDQIDEEGGLEVKDDLRQHVSSGSFFLGVFVVTAPIIEYSLFRALETLVFLNRSFVIFAAPLPIMFVGMTHYVNILRKMETWQLSEKKAVVERALMWVGFFGQILNLIGLFINSHALIDKQPWLYAVRIAFVTVSTPVFILQILVMDMSFDRKPTVISFNSVFVLLCFNISRGLSGVVNMATEALIWDRTLSISFTDFGLQSISATCISIYGLYSVVHFSAMLSSLYK